MGYKEDKKKNKKDKKDKENKKKDKENKKKYKEDKKKNKENKDKENKKKKDKPKEYENMYAIEAPCEEFSNFDQNSVETSKCNLEKCNFKCKNGFININYSVVKCDKGKWSFDETVKCEPEY